MSKRKLSGQKSILTRWLQGEKHTEGNACLFCRLKTWLRSKMGQNRLCGLALLHIHREIEIPTEDIIQRFAKMKKRHTDLIL